MSRFNSHPLFPGCAASGAFALWALPDSPALVSSRFRPRQALALCPRSPRNGVSKGTPAIPSRLQTIRNSKHPMHLRQFSLVSTLTKSFPFSFSKNRRMEQQ
ncbi:hypothetical protein AVEN_257326-1 [Araneus ventricosus]|uniref:Uncharacterized protein n=1 Tax=Araneus ventricosus TaxID=182803 RepID=A0A4Y2CBV7_ARAVE|nr:hypothetical protein AVEN_257326-1 [Araneus ventricosus]